MHPHPPQHQPTPIFIAQPRTGRATAIGVWILVLFFVGPIVLCCLGCGLLGGWGFLTGTPGVDPTPSVSVSVSP